MLVLRHQGRVLLEQRPDSGIWGGLLSLPELDGMQELNPDSPMGDLLDFSSTLPEQSLAAKQVANQFGEVTDIRQLPGFLHGLPTSNYMRKCCNLIWRSSHPKSPNRVMSGWI